MDTKKLALMQEIAEACDELDNQGMLREADIMEGIMMKVADEEGMVKMAVLGRSFKEWSQYVRNLLINIKGQKNPNLEELNKGLGGVLSEGNSWLRAMSNKLSDPNVESNYPVMQKGMSIIQDFKSDVQAKDVNNVLNRADGIARTINQAEDIIDQTISNNPVGKFE